MRGDSNLTDSSFYKIQETIREKHKDYLKEIKRNDRPKFKKYEKESLWKKFKKLWTK